MSEGYKNWAAGDTLTAADLEDYTVLQSIMRFADAATRSGAVGATEGYTAFLKDLNTITLGTGSTWSTIGPVHGALTSYTPTLVQSGAVTKTALRTTYSRVGRRVTGQFNLAATGAGSATFPVLVGIPVAAVASVDQNDIVGVGFVRDASANIKYRGLLVHIDTVQLQFLTLHSTADGYLGNADFTAALASGDQISGKFEYEAAADA